MQIVHEDVLFYIIWQSYYDILDTQPVICNKTMRIKNGPHSLCVSNCRHMCIGKITLPLKVSQHVSYAGCLESK